KADVASRNTEQIDFIGRQEAWTLRFLPIEAEYRTGATFHVAADQFAVVTAAIVEPNIHARCGVKFQLATLDYCRTAGDALLEVCNATVRHLDRAARVIDRALDVKDAAVVGRKCAGIGNLIAAGVESKCLL